LPFSTGIIPAGVRVIRLAFANWHGWVTPARGMHRIVEVTAAAAVLWPIHWTPPPGGIRRARLASWPCVRTSLVTSRPCQYRSVTARPHASIPPCRSSGPFNRGALVEDVQPAVPANILFHSPESRCDRLRLVIEEYIGANGTHIPALGKELPQC